MSVLTPEAGLTLAYQHIVGTAPVLYLRPGSEKSSMTTLQFWWEFPAGGSVALTIGFDVEQIGARPKATLVPRARVSAAIGAHVADALTFARSVHQIVEAAVEAEALMRQHTYLTGREEESQAKP